MKNTPFRSVATALITLGAPCLALAQTTWDYSATPDKNWSSFTNWSTDVSPAATAVIFGATSGVTANATTVGNIVDQSFTVDSLTYNSISGSAWQVTQIASGQTLTVDAATAPATSLLIGGAAAGSITQAVITGAGSLVISESTAALTVSNTGSTSGRASLDMSGLSTFTASVESMNIGTGGTGFGTVYLADTSTITATTLTSGGSGSSYGASTISNRLYFGTTTTLNVDTIAFGSGRTIGEVKFRPATGGINNGTAVSGATLTIRGKTGGTSRASLTVGDLTETGTSSNTSTSSLDLTGGTVDAMVSTLKIGRSPGGLSSSYGASLSMAAGTFDATTVIVGETANNNTGAGTLTGTLNVSGGTFTAGTMTLANNLNSGTRATRGNLNVSGTTTAVNVTGDLTMGVRTGATVTPTVTVSGGTLTVGGNLAEGTGAGANINSTVNLSGGTLDMTGGNIAVDTFNFSGGTLKDVASFGAGTLALGAVDGTFTAKSLIGSFTLTGTGNLSLSLANDFTPVSGFTLIDNDGTGDSIAGTFATINGSAFGGGNSFSLTNNTGTYNFTLNYAGGDGNDLVATLNAVPEPSTYAAFAGVLTLGFSFWRRRR